MESKSDPIEDNVSGKSWSFYNKTSSSFWGKKNRTYIYSLAQQIPGSVNQIYSKGLALEIMHCICFLSWCQTVSLFLHDMASSGQTMFVIPVRQPFRIFQCVSDDTVDLSAEPHNHVCNFIMTALVY